MDEKGEKERFSVEAVRDVEAPTVPMLPTVNPAVEEQKPTAYQLPAFVYVVVWITLSSAIIIFNKKILSNKEAPFPFPIVLTTWHLVFATVMTQIMARTTTMLDGRKKVKMTGRLYLRAIVPIGAAFSGSLMCGNLTYLYLSVAFIQMLKATTPVAVLIAGWVFQIEKVELHKLFTISFIVGGIVIASLGEIKFILIGFLFQLGGIVFEAIRLVTVQRLLSAKEYKMDPLVSLYYFAPICAIMNFCVALVFEIPKLQLEDFYRVGLGVLFANALLAFALNVSVVFLIGRTSGLVMTLCGVLKDILLVAASILIWGTYVSGLQYFGYGIALCGLVYYKLGAATIKAQFSEGSRMWAEYGAKHPALRKLIVFGVVITLMIMVLLGLAPTVGVDPTQLASVLKDSDKASTPATPA